MLEQIILVGISITFIILNINILIQDFKEHLIKNKYIFVLFLMFIPYAFLQGINMVEIIYNFILFLFLGITLYSLGIWGAGDAKYLLVLSLFISQYGAFSFVGNIAIITILFLIILFIKNIFFPNKKGEYLHTMIINDFFVAKEGFKSNLQLGRDKAIFKGINSINTFFLVFIIIRILRFLFVEKYSYLFIIEGEPQMKIIIFFIGLLIALFIALRKAFQRIKKSSILKKNLNGDQIQSFGNIIFFIIAGIILYIDFSKNKDFFFDQMYYIFTLYLFIYIIIKTCIYIYMKSFIDLERKTIDVQKLQMGDTIDKQFYQKNIQNISKKNILYRKVKDLESVTFTKELIIKNYPNSPQIIITQTFAFSIVIFIGFIVTFIYGDLPTNHLYGMMKELLSTLYS